MRLRRYARCLLLILAAGLLPGGLAGVRAQVDTLPTRFYWLPYTQQRHDSVRKERVRLRYWLLRYTERRYRDAGPGPVTLAQKTRAAWFFGRVTRQVYYHDDNTRFRLYRYRRNLHPRHHRITWNAHAEYLVAERHFDGLRRARKVVRHRDGYYLEKRRDMGQHRFQRRAYQTRPHW